MKKLWYYEVLKFVLFWWRKDWCILVIGIGIVKMILCGEYVVVYGELVILVLFI